MVDGVKLVSSSALGIACETILVGGRAHVVFPPTIKRLCGAGLYLSDIRGNTIQEMFSNLTDLKSACKALSWFIQGDESLEEELSEGTLEEVVNGLAVALGMVGIENFPKLSGLVRNVRSLIATTR